jgi:RimJ/RimL family protein N-acetyltransferase
MNNPPLKRFWDAPVQREFSGRYVSLAPVDAEADYLELFEAGHRTPEHRSVWRFLWQGPFEDEMSMRDWLRICQSSSDPLFFTVKNLADNRKVGMVSIMSVVPEMGRAELGHIWYAPEAQRTNVNTEAVFLLLKYLLGELQYRRAEWKCDARNERSRKAALRLGFVFEGVFRQHMMVKGENRDTAWFSLLDKEWARAGANMSRWLYDAKTLSLSELNQSNPPFQRTAGL